MILDPLLFMHLWICLQLKLANNNLQWKSRAVGTNLQQQGLLIANWIVFMLHLA